MKHFKVSNGEVRVGYEYTDLSPDNQEKVLLEQVEFEVELMDENSPYWEIALEMERMQTPWFLGSEIYHKHKRDLIETIKANHWLFDEDGDMLPITYHTDANGEILKATYGKKEHLVEFI